MLPSGKCPRCMAPAAAMVDNFDWNIKNTTKTQFLPSFLTVDRRKKAKQFRDPKQTLHSCHQCNKLPRNVKHQYSSWRAQLHFELSNIVNGQKFEKLLTLNEAQNNLWVKYGPIAVKLLRDPSPPFHPPSQPHTMMVACPPHSPCWKESTHLSPLVPVI